MIERLNIIKSTFSWWLKDRCMIVQSLKRPYLSMQVLVETSNWAAPHDHWFAVEPWQIILMITWGPSWFMRLSPPSICARWCGLICRWYTVWTCLIHFVSAKITLYFFLLAYLLAYEYATVPLIRRCQDTGHRTHRVFSPGRRVPWFSPAPAARMPWRNGMDPWRITAMDP